MIALLLALLVGLMFIPALLGLFLIWHVARPQKAPADMSNRINKIRLIWFVLTREYLFTEIFGWLKHDELDNVTPYK